MHHEIRNWLDVLGKIAIAAVAAFIGYLFSLQKQQNDDIKLITEYIVARDEVQRELGKSLFEDYVKNGRLPESFIASVLRFSTSSPDKDFTKDITASVEAGIEADTVSSSLVARVEDTLPIRIYFHIQKQEQRPFVEKLATMIENDPSVHSEHVIVPGIDLLDVGLTKNELRCFRKSECGTLGRQLVAFLKGLGAETTLVDLSEQYKDAQHMPANYFEAWFADLPATS